MAPPAAAPQQPASAQVVGNAFVQQYYHILHQSPGIVHRFYQDLSKLGRPEEDGSMSITTTMDAINSKILSLHYDEFRAEIKSVDAQESLNGGVNVLVTGYLTGKDNVLRNFTQSFFLAPQDKGFYVLNDMFRYMENASHNEGNNAPVEDVEAPANPEQGFQHQPVPKTFSELTQDVLESLFNTRKSSKHEPDSMNWRTVVKKMESIGQIYDYPSEDTVEKQHVPAKGDDYQNYRNTASQHWDSMKSYYHKAATAYANGKREYAAYLSDKGRVCNEKARQADQRASQDIFNSRNKSIENVITIDLHGQHVKQGMKLLKLHLLFGAYVRSVRLLRVITGCGSHGVGKSKLKQSVVDLLETENIEWKEENRGTLLIKLNGQREFSFLDSDSDTE